MEHRDEKIEEEIAYVVNSEIVITEVIINEEDEYMKSASPESGSGSIEYLVDEPIISFRNVKSALDSISNEDNNQNNFRHIQYVYTNNEYYNEDYVKNPLLRGISLSKWPSVGFGFKINRCPENRFYYINEVVSSSPAEPCLNVGDLILELDEFDNPFDEFNNLNEMEDYLSNKESIHLVALESSNYLKFKLKNKSIKSFTRNCEEEIVVVSWNQLKQETDS